MDPRLKQRIHSRGLLAPTDISRMGLLAELQPPDDAQTPDANPVTTPSSPRDAARKPLSPPDKAPPAQAAEDVKPPSDKEKLRAFLMQRVTGAPDAAAPVSPEEQSAKLRGAYAPSINKVEAGMWARLGKPAPSQLPTNTAAPYQTDREKLNDYLRAQMATKTGVAQQLYGDMTAEDTAAATQAQAKARQEAADKEKAAELERQKARDDETARHNKETEDLQRQGLEAKAKKGAPGAPPAPDEVQFGSDVYKYDGPPVSKELKLEGAKKVREKSAQWGQVVTGLDALETALARFVANPTPENKGLLYGPALTAAGSTNAAIGQGAMSQEEKAAQFQALGISLDAGGVEAAIKRAFGDPDAAKEVLSRVRQMKALAKSSVDSAARAYHYSAAAPQAPAAPSAVAKGPPQPSSFTTLVDKDGVEFDVDSSKTAAILKARPDLKVKQ